MASFSLDLFVTPIAVILSIWSYKISLLRINIEYALTMVVAAYSAVCACLSPCPPLVGTQLGSGLQVFSWVFTGFMFMRLRIVTATKLNEYGDNILQTVGNMTCFGQLFGGILIYVVVEQFHLLKEKPACVDDLSYCS